MAGTEDTMNVQASVDPIANKDLGLLNKALDPPRLVVLDHTVLGWLRHLWQTNVAQTSCERVIEQNIHARGAIE